MIALLTDFGDSEYVGIMRGVILSIAPNARIVDLTNNVKSHNIREGAWIILNACKYFPKGTIFLCVVDPGVGTERNAIAVRTKNYFFIGPDNGLIYPAANSDGIIGVRKLDTKYASKTFHGRDVFAKSVGLLESGKSFESLGEKTKLNGILQFYKKGREGEVVSIDSFGNIITNLEHIGRKSYSVVIGRRKVEMNFFDTYESAADGLFLIESSSKTLEISRRNKSAAEILKVSVGERVRIV